MIRHLWTIMCRGTSIDRDTNNVTLFAIVEQLAVPRPFTGNAPITAVPAFFEIATLWMRDPLDDPCRGQCEMRVRPPDGGIVVLGQYEIDLTEVSRHRAVAKIFGFPAQGPGLHHVEAWIRQGENADFVIAGSTPINVIAPVAEEPLANNGRAEGQ